MKTHQETDEDLYAQANEWLDLLEAFNWDTTKMSKLNAAMRKEFGHQRVDKAVKALKDIRRLLINDK